MNKHQKPTPPKWLDRLLGWFCKSGELEILRGDLYELYDMRIANMSKFKADLYFCLEVLDLFRPFAIKRSSTINSLIMT